MCTNYQLSNYQTIKLRLIILFRQVSIHILAVTYIGMYTSPPNSKPLVLTNSPWGGQYRDTKREENNGEISWLVIAKWPTTYFSVLFTVNLLFFTLSSVVRSVESPVSSGWNVCLCCGYSTLNTHICWYYDGTFCLHFFHPFRCILNQLCVQPKATSLFCTHFY